MVNVSKLLLVEKAHTQPPTMTIATCSYICTCIDCQLFVGNIVYERLTGYNLGPAAVATSPPMTLMQNLWQAALACPRGI